jgi:hypothetical protein
VDTVQESVEVAVPARVVYELLCRVDEYHRLRSCLRRAVLVECRPARLLRWRSVDGPVRSETMLIQPMLGRCRITVECVGPGDMSVRLRNDLIQLKLYVEAVATPDADPQSSTPPNTGPGTRLASEATHTRNARAHHRTEPVHQPNLSTARRYGD